MPFLRIVIPELPHHLVLRGNNRRNLFSYPWEYRTFLHLLQEASERHACPIHALALMKNHVHLLTTPPSVKALSRMVQSFAQRYALGRNRRRDASGKLFEERFWRFPIFDDAGMAAVTAYIELNPVRAGLCDAPGESRLTTYNLHAGRPDRTMVPPSLWTPSEWYLRLGPSRCQDFATWVTTCRARDVRPERVHPSDPRIRRPNGKRAT